MAVQVGQPAPEFALKGVKDGEFVDVKLSDYRGKWVVLFFYPLDFTFVCPTEIQGFAKHNERVRGPRRAGARREHGQRAQPQGVDRARLRRLSRSRSSAT